MKRKSDDTFWISYADLATGTMVVFLIVAAVMMAANQKREEERAKEVAELAEQVQIILGTRAKLANALKLALADESSVSVDPVTAQLVFEQSENTVQFEGTSEVELDDKDKDFVERFAPKYLCALWEHEYDACNKPGRVCERIDPEAPQGVRRVLVSGHADLLGTARNNQQLSAQRANAVVDHALATLETGDPELYPSGSRCAEHPEKVRDYAHERLVSVGAGDVEHCRRRLESRGGWSCDSDPLRRDQDSAESQYRRVTFELELTGADMTGLIDDLLELRRATSADAPVPESDPLDSEPSLDELRRQVAEGCWKDMNAYHGCETIRQRCEQRVQKSGAVLPHCAGFDLGATQPAQAP